MKRIAVATRLIIAASMAVLAGVPIEADAAGVYEDAAAESAFLLSPRRIVLGAALDFSRQDAAEATVYRVGASFPLRSAFKLAVEQPFVTVSDSTGIDSGVGDLWVRGSARVWGGHGRSLSLLGYFTAGTGNSDFFPFSSQTLDVNASVGYVDSIGAVTVCGLAGRTWVNRELSAPVDTRHTDHWRGNASAVVSLGPRSFARGGALYQNFSGGATRWILYTGAGFATTASVSLLAGFQLEIGPSAQRVSDWAASAGLRVQF